ncbi:MAG: aminopeptidase N [Thiohalocapsa sp. PB-PSB1]|jgi:aminopeptidase N|nr:MAG: aminopeptidase N [Thiohalocapsa sp. PB-PSB1]HCS89745.1 aminopeptidase N [Chromatiaceae bacterium]
MYRTTPPVVRLEDYHPPEFLIDQVDLRFDLDVDQTAVQAEISLRRNPAATRGDGDLRLDGEQLELVEVALDNRVLPPVEYETRDDALIVHRVPDRFRLRTRVRIQPKANTALEGLYLSGNMLCTQCEAEGFRRITYFLDRPDIMARFQVTLIADPQRYPVLLSNGNPAGREMLPDGRQLVRWDDPYPKPCYLFALVAGDLAVVEDHFVTRSGREILLQIFVEPENLDKCDHAMRSLKKAMRWDEENYGREYDLDLFMIVAVSHFNMGAMENKGLNIFNAKYILARPDTATDTDFADIEGVVAHEYFHNWTGNRITCRDWFQLSLKEGFTVYRDQEFSADMGSREVQRIEDVRMLRARQFPEDAGPMAHPVRPDSYIEINNFYTATVYEKGAEVVRMQANLLGPERFRAGTDRYFERFDGQAVTTDDFVDCMEQAGAVDLTQFRRWYSQSGTPVLECADSFDADTGTYSLEIRQHTPAMSGEPTRLPLHIPFALGLLNQDGEDLSLAFVDESPTPAPGTRMLALRQPVERFTFRLTDLTDRPIPSLLRGFSAPVKVRYPYSDADLTFLMSHDSDGFNRWDAAQSLAQRLLLTLVEDETRPVPESFIHAFRTALLDRHADQALLAEVLTLPSESYLGDQMEVVDVPGIHRARKTLANRIGTSLRDDLHELYEQNRQPAEYNLSSESMGRRALRNCALDYLMQAPDADACALACAQFDAGHNMTDVVAALRLLVNASPQVAGDAGERALDDFYQRWSHDPLVLDKWFALQAQSSRPETLARVKKLMDHQDFSLTNPNRVRSLIGAFAVGNPLHFHAEDGSGYCFLIDRIIDLDPLNPQVASRLLYPMTRWRRYDASRQTLMCKQLERVLEVESLSGDVYEVVSKTLS